LGFFLNVLSQLLIYWNCIANAALNGTIPLAWQAALQKRISKQIHESSIHQTIEKDHCKPQTDAGIPACPARQESGNYA